MRGLACKLCQKTHFLAVGYLLFQEDLLPLGQHQRDQSLDRVAAKIRRRSVKKVFVYIGKHAGGRLEGVVGSLEARVFETVLVRGVAGENGRDVVDYRRLLVCERVLGGGFVREGIIPAAGSATAALAIG